MKINEVIPPLPLFDQEKIISIQHFKKIQPQQLPAPSNLLARLGQSRSMSELGENGPVLASLNLKARFKQLEFRRYEALFARDSLRVAIDLMNDYPKLAESTIVRLAQLQGLSFNSNSEEEPGKIIHEARDPRTDPIAQELSSKLNWDWPYYGSIDSTPGFILALLQYCQRCQSFDFMNFKYTDRHNQEQSIRIAFNRALDWILNKLANDKYHFLSYKSLNPNGIENQVWRDSWDSYFHQTGEMANHNKPVISTDVQNLVVDALLGASIYFKEETEDRQKASELRIIALDLFDRIRNFLWTDDQGGYFVLGADYDAKDQLHPLKVKTSDMGHLLGSSYILRNKPEESMRRELIIKKLFSPKLLSFSGIRTLASDEVRFRPGAYHNGSVWIWDNYLIAKALDQHGYYGLSQILKRILLSDVHSVKRYVEYLRGDDLTQHLLNDRIVDVWDAINHKINRLEQPPQDIQAWTVSAIYAIKNGPTFPCFALDKTKRQFEQKIIKEIAFLDQID
jgi:glycogen debranching enzyme